VQSSDVVGQAFGILAAVASGGAGVAQGVATRVLGDMVAERLRRDGHASAWDDFTRTPQNDSLGRHLLQQALQEDADFRVRVGEAVLAAADEKPRNSGQQSIHIAGPGEAQIGDRGDTIADSRIATRGGSYHEGDIHNQRNRVTHKKSNAGAYVALAVVALVIMIGVGTLLAKGVPALLRQSRNGGLTASSTCQQFLNYDEQTEQQAMVDIAVSKSIGGFGSPLALPEIRYECSSEPAMTIGAVIERDRGNF
jgi:hypothetical protein